MESDFLYGGWTEGSVMVFGDGWFVEGILVHGFVVIE